MCVVRLTCCLVSVLCVSPFVSAADDPLARIPTAWGKPVKGLQAGIRANPYEHVLLAVTVLEVVVRNVGNETITYDHLQLAFGGENSEGTVTAKGVEVFGGFAPKVTRFETKVVPGEVKPLARLPIFRPEERPDSIGLNPKVRLGKNQVGAEGVVLRLANGKEIELATGYLDIDVPAPKKDQANKVPKQVVKDLGEKTIAILSGATKVEVFRLDKLPGPDTTPKTIGIDKMQFTITATGKEMDKVFAAKVRALLFDKATRTLSGASGFRGDIALRLWKNKESVTVIVDYEGSQFLVVAGDAEGKQTYIAYGGFLFNAKGNFDDGTLFGKVKALAVEAFPDDAKLKALKKVEVEAADPPPVKK